MHSVVIHVYTIEHSNKNAPLLYRIKWWSSQTTTLVKEDDSTKQAKLICGVRSQNQGWPGSSGWERLWWRFQAPVMPCAELSGSSTTMSLGRTHGLCSLYTFLCMWNIPESSLLKNRICKKWSKRRKNYKQSRNIEADLKNIESW